MVKKLSLKKKNRKHNHTRRTSNIKQKFKINPCFLKWVQKDFNCAKSTSTPIITYNQTLGNKNDVWHYNNGINTKFLMAKHVQKEKRGKDIGRKVTHFKDMHKTTLDRKNNLLESIANDHSKSNMMKIRSPIYETLNP
jgi:hypothetical protein